MTTPPTIKPRRLHRTFAALKYRNYRLWFIGQIVSLFGTWMQTTAQGFLVFQLTHSPVYLGYVGFAAGMPAWVLTLYAGVVADRVPRRTLMTITQTSMMVFAFVLAGLTFTNLVQPWHIIALAFSLGVANAFDAPARQAFVGEMVEREDLTNAIAMNSTMFQSATAVGPAVAGVVYAMFGPAWCFAVNGASFIAVIIALRMMKLKPFVRPVRPGSTFGELKEGIRYVLHHPVVRMLFAVVATSSMFGLSFTALIPAWVVNVLGGNAATNGLMYSVRGVGALIGALIIASLGRINYKGRLLTMGTLIYPVFFFIFAFIHWIPLSMLFLALAGMGMIFINNLANAMVQTMTPENLRGRVMGAYMLIFFGFMPLGALWTGGLAERFGEATAVIVNALLAFSFALALWFFFPRLRKQTDDEHHHHADDGHAVHPSH